MFKKLQLTLLLFLFGTSLAIAQSGSLTGQVTDSESGETVPGANILITELERGAVTDVDGNYEIANVPAGTYNLTASFVGYRTYRESVSIQAGQETVVNIELRVGAVGLDEVVVSGYAPTTKRELAGSISSVSSKDIQDVPLQNTESLLQGRAAGVRVTTTSGNPGGAFRVNIRGTGSINAASEPLYIVDGVQISFSNQSGQTSTSPLNAINPSDIESIEVLKDASSAAIYGSQASAGVVIITTKRGQEGRTRITARAERGVRSLDPRVDYINGSQYLDYLGEASAINAGFSPANQETFQDAFNTQRDAYENFFINSVFGADPNSPEGSPQLAETNWQDIIYTDGVSSKYNISASGGDDQTAFYVSGGYEDTEGTAFDTDFTALRVRSNLDHKISDQVSGSLNLNLSRTTQFGVCQDGNFINCPVSQAMFEPIFSFPYLADGSYNPNTRFGLGNNPVAVRDEVDRNVAVFQIVSNANLTYRPTNWLSFSGLVGIDYRNTQDERFDSPIVRPAQGGFLNFANRNLNNITMNLTANGRKTFDNVHNVSGFIGTEYRRRYSENQFVTGEGFPGTFFKVLSASSTPTTAAGTNTEWRLGSYFGNAKYNYDEKYYVSVTARYDGHSRFGANTRWGFFPSIQGAWLMSEEDFFNVDFISELKLRAGYGTTGNSSIGDFSARGLYSTVGSYLGATALTPTQLANVNLSWEEAVEVNVGVDFEALDGRLSGSIDVYQKDNNELLLARPLPGDSGFGAITENIGSVRNEGIEFEINSVNLNTSDFLWSTRFNIAFTSNEILELPDGEDINPNSTTQSLRIGEAIGAIQVPKWAGVNPADGRPMWYDIDGNITYNPEQSVDAVDYNNGIENTVGGFGNRLSYKGITLDAFLQFSFGQWALASSDYYFTRTPDFRMNLEEQVLERWKQPGDITWVPRAVESGNDFTETANFRTQLGTNSFNNASYIRLKNVSLSYSLPGAVTDRLGIGNIRVFATGINLLTWTAWPWYDPEIAFSPTDIFTNVSAASYPTERQVNAGIEIQF